MMDIVMLLLGVQVGLLVYAPFFTVSSLRRIDELEQKVNRITKRVGR